MAMRVDVELAGLKKAISGISAFNIAKSQAVKDAVNTAALNVQKGAKKRCAVDTGRLRSSIAIEPFNGGLSMKVGTKVNYAPFVEFGTGQRGGKSGVEPPDGYEYGKRKGMPAQPFLFPAWDEERPEFIKALKDVLSK
jgi:HK97 gp10 family phage protein